MKIDLKYKRIDGSILILKKCFGIGVYLNFVNAYSVERVIFALSIDFIFIRFWMHLKKSKIGKIEDVRQEYSKNKVGISPTSNFFNG